MFVSQIIVLTAIFYQKCYSEQNMEGFVVGGEYAHIENHPYCASLAIGFINRVRLWGCGSSIINQRILLTAAHCLEDCNRTDRKCQIMVTVGNSNKVNGKTFLTHKFRRHEHYDEETIENDVALIFVNQDIKFNKAVSKVILMKNPPYGDHAVVAGWGVTDINGFHSTNLLKHVDQDIILKHKCEKFLPLLPDGTVCAGKNSRLDGGEFADVGDSGSALVVRDLIQVGLVSFKNPKITRSVVVYTDVGHFYRWIKHTAERLYCRHSRGKKKKQKQLD